jgi:large subunit ribosomal protein L10
MNKEQKQEVIETLKSKFSQYSNFYITDTQKLSVAQITNLRRHCFDKQVEMKVAKNTLIKKALESLDNDKYSAVYDSLHQVTALMFSESPKDPAVIISSFRKSLNGEKPLLKAAFLNGDIFVGDNQLLTLTKIKTKNELIGEVIGLLMSPIQRVIGALQNRPEKTEATDAAQEATKPAEAKVIENESNASPAQAPEVPSATPAVKVEDSKSNDKAPESQTPAKEITSEGTEVSGKLAKPESGVDNARAEVEVKPSKSGPASEAETKKTDAIQPEAEKPEAGDTKAGPEA